MSEIKKLKIFGRINYQCSWTWIIDEHKHVHLMTPKNASLIFNINTTYMESFECLKIF